MVGESQHAILVTKEKLFCVEPLMTALTGPWREGQENIILLPEDDVETWETAAKILTGDRFLFDDAPIQVFDVTGKSVEYRHGGSHEQMGNWRFPEATFSQFLTIVNLFELADKYLWAELRENCLERIMQFPIGPQALAVLVDIPPELYKFPEGCDRSLMDGLDKFIKESLHYHSNRYDEWYGGNRHGVRNFIILEERSKQYDPLDEFMKANMTAKAWAIYKEISESRAAKDRQTRSEMDTSYWQCDSGRQGVLIDNWNLYEAVDHCLDKEVIATRPYGEGIKAEIKWYNEKFSGIFPDHPLSEAKRGDIIIQISDGLPDNETLNHDYVAGFNTRTQQDGWYPRSWIRFLEQSANKDCCGPCCQKD